MLSWKLGIKTRNDAITATGISHGAVCMALSHIRAIDGEADW